MGNYSTLLSMINRARIARLVGFVKPPGVIN